MKCPRCVQSVHRAAASCPHCGFTMAHADQAFGEENVPLTKLTDSAGILRMKERDPLRATMERFEVRFPQLFVAVYLGAFDDLVSLRELGFWMLNRSDYTDVSEQRPNENGILVLIDVNSKSASITYGYALMPYLDEDSTFAALSAGHPMFLQGDYLNGLRAIIRAIEGFLVKGWKRVKKNPDLILAASGQQPKRVEALLQRIRGGGTRDDERGEGGES